MRVKLDLTTSILTSLPTETKKSQQKENIMGKRRRRNEIDHSDLPAQKHCGISKSTQKVTESSLVFAQLKIELISDTLHCKNIEAAYCLFHGCKRCYANLISL